MSGVEIRVRSDSRQARRDLGQLERSVGNIEKTAQNVTRTFKTLAAGIATAFAGTALTKSINSATDSLTSLENRVALITGRSKELNEQLDNLYRIAKETKSPIDATVETFNRFARSLSAAGKSTEEINQAVRAVGLATTISGGSAESTRAALFQLGQGLASGQLRGQELNSVLEQAPRLARVIADSLEVPFGSLRKLAEQGQITTEVVFEALIDQTAALESEFGNIALTSDKAFTLLQDQVARVTGEISKELGITAAFTTRLVALTDYIEANRREIVRSVVNAGTTLVDTFSGVTAVIRGLTNVIRALFGRALDAIPNLTTPFREFTQVLQAEVIGAVLYTSAVIKRLGLDFEALFDKVFNTRFQGAIREIFRSRSLKDFGDALYNLGEALDSYGRRWYNFGNFAERALRTTNVLLYETGIYLGLVDQTLVRLRYTSFERFTKAFSVFSSILGEIQRNIAATNFFVAIQVSVVKSIQLIENFISALNNLSDNRLNKISITVQKLFKGIKDTAEYYLNQTVNLVRRFAGSVNAYFANIYDKVIGNSFWTDTMEGTYAKAQEWLPKTKNLLKQFGQEVTQLYANIAEIFSATNISRESKIKLVIEQVGFNTKAKLNAAKDLAETVISAVATGTANAFSALRELSPQLAAVLAAGVAGALASIVAPSYFAATFGKLGPFFAAALAVSVATAFNGAFLKSGILEEIANGLGLAVGQGINTIVTNVPAILKTLIRVANEFGKGLADAIGNSIVGLPAQILSFLPGGGLLTTILYGGLGAALFFKGVRTLLLSNIKQLLVTLGTAQGSGLLYNLFVGSNPDNLKKNITAKTKEQANAAATTAAAANRRAGRLQLAQIGGYVLGAELLLGDLIGTTGAAIAGITASVAQQAILGDPAKVSAIVSTFNSLLSTVIGKVASANVFSTASSVAGSFLSGLSSKFTAVSAGITAKNTATTSLFAASWGRATSFASASFAKFNGSAVRRLGKIGLLVAGLTAAFATMASASEDGGEQTGAGFGAIGFALLAFGDTILQYLLPAIGKLGKGILNVGKFAARSIGRVAVGALSKMALGVGTILSGIPLITASFLAAAAVITGAAVGGVIYSAFFGKGDTFLERVKNNFNGVLAYFNLLNVSLSETRQESLKVLKNVEKLIGKEFNIKLSAELDSVDLSQASDTQLLAIKDAVNNLDKNRKKADGEQRVFGAITENTRAAIKAAVEDVEAAIKEGSGEGSPTAVVASQLRTTFDKILESADGNAIQRLFSSDASSAAQARTQANILKKIIQDERFSADGAFTTPGVAQAFADQILTQLPNETRESIPPEIIGLLTQISTQGVLDSRVADAFFDIRAVDAGILEKLLLGKGGLSIPQEQLDRLGAALDASFRTYSAKTFQERKSDVNANLKTVLGRELTQGERASLDSRTLTKFESLINRTEKLENFLGFDTDDEKTINALIKQAQGSDNNEILQSVKELEALRLRLKDLVKSELRFTIEKGTVADLNAQLQELGAGLLNKGLGNLQRVIEGDAEFKGFKIQEQIDRINKTQAYRNKLLNDEKLTQEEITERINGVDRSIQNQIKSLDFYIQKLNLRQGGEEDWLATIQQAAQLATDRDINLNDLLKLDDKTLQKLVEAQGKLNLLSLELQAFGQLGFIGGNSPFTNQTKGQLEAAITEQIKIIQDALKTAGKASGGSGETIFEKFVGRLSDSGFAFDLSTASTLAANSINKLQAPLKKIEDAQKRIVKASLGDTKARSAALDTIRKSREEIFDILKGGTVEQATIGVEALGLDPSIVNSSEKAQMLALEIRDTQLKINAASMQDLDTRNQLNEQLRLQQMLLDGITTQAESSAKAMETSLAEGLKGLLKGESTIKGFFNRILDTLTNQIIDTVVNAFISAFFIKSGLESTFETFFGNLFQSGQTIGETFGKQVGDSVKSSLDASTRGGGSWLNNLFGGSGQQGSILSFLLGSGGGGGLFSSIFGLSFGSFLGIPGSYQGGIVPSTPFSQVGKDSVPMMLTPGEMVIPARRVDSMMKTQNNGGSTVVNLSITGDVSRQTRTEIVKMLPTIANGVNAQNKERNFKYR